MDKKRAIVSLSVLMIITLALLGVTYAYYRTRVIGNKSN